MRQADRRKKNVAKNVKKEKLACNFCTKLLICLSVFMMVTFNYTVTILGYKFKDKKNASNS